MRTLISAVSGFVLGLEFTEALEAACPCTDGGQKDGTPADGVETNPSSGR